VAAATLSLCLIAHQGAAGSHSRQVTENSFARRELLPMARIEATSKQSPSVSLVSGQVSFLKSLVSVRAKFKPSER
jgi:hypothetical protein